MISLLLTMRKNSKFFAKFMAGFLLHTKDFSNVELLVLASAQDEWNKDLFELYKDKITVYYEDKKIGKNGRHIFYNELASYAKGDWLWHMCDDHYLLEGYDWYLTNYISQYNPSEVHIVIPRVQNSGSIAHLISRGWYEATGRFGSHGNIDSYLNNVCESMVDQGRIHHPDTPVLWDFTTDPSIMTPQHSKIDLDPEFKVYDITSPETKAEVEKDAQAIFTAIRSGK